MGTSHDEHSETASGPTPSSVAFLFGTIGDTTWRMFLPTIGLLIVGDYVDRALSTKPWLTILGIVIGSGIATLLIRNQLRKHA